MTERKTTEIKLRVTPDEKLRWQTEAERQGVALSELIRQTMNGLIENEALLTLKEAHPLMTLTDGGLVGGAGECVTVLTASSPRWISLLSGEDVPAPIEVQPWKYEARRSG